MPDFAQPLREEDVDPDPITQFAAWFADAGAAIRAPEAVALATATPDGRPSVRMVLLKHFGPEGFVFYSNHDSRKGREMAANPHAALMFYWDQLGRQVRIEGPVQRMTQDESAPYIRTRPRGSQIGALASPQSQPIAGREVLERRVAELTARFADEEVPLPDAWGGFWLEPVAIEFWQHRVDRLHDRLQYTREPDGSWRMERLAP